MRVEMVAAMDRNRVIGASDGGIPWKLPRDVARFRGIAAGRTLAVGRTTFEEMAGWFTDQCPIVLTSRALDDSTLVARGQGEALEIASDRGAESLLVIGGAAIFELFLDRADRLFLTRVEAAFEGTRTFPALDPQRWLLVESERHEADDEHAVPFVFETWDRIS